VKKLDKLALALSMLIILGFVSCQSTPGTSTLDTTKYENIVSIAVDAVNSNDTDALLKHFSRQFNFFGIGGHVGRIAAEGLYQRIDDRILTYNLVNVERDTKRKLVTLTYEVEWASGPKEADFVFETPSGMLLTLTLVPSKMETIEFEAEVER